MFPVFDLRLSTYSRSHSVVILVYTSYYYYNTINQKQPGNFVNNHNKHSHTDKVIA